VTLFRYFTELENVARAAAADVGSTVGRDDDDEDDDQGSVDGARALPPESNRRPSSLLRRAFGKKK